MRGRHVPPSASHYVGQVIAAALREAEGAGTGRAAGARWSRIPGRAGGLAARMLAQLAGQSRQSAMHLGAEVAALTVACRAEMAREARDTRSTGRAADLLADAEWPGGRGPVPPRSVIAPRRETN